MKMKTLLAFLVTLLLQACATQNKPGIASYTPIPRSQIVGALQGSETASASTATIVVKRDPGIYGSGLSSIFTIDGRRLARIKPAQFLEIHLPEKEYLFGVDWSDGLGLLATSTTRELAVDCRAGRTYFLRLFPQTANGIIIERTSQ